MKESSTHLHPLSLHPPAKRWQPRPCVFSSLAGEQGFQTPEAPERRGCTGPPPRPGIFLGGGHARSAWETTSSERNLSVHTGGAASTRPTDATKPDKTRLVTRLRLVDRLSSTVSAWPSAPNEERPRCIVHCATRSHCAANLLTHSCAR